MIKNYLDAKIITDSDDFKVFEDILKLLHYITPKQISRSEFNSLNGDFLKETGENRFDKKYDLFLPIDLSYGESLFFIDFLANKFNLENYTNYEKIISGIKISIGTILRSENKNEGVKYLNNLAKKYNFSNNFIKKNRKL